MQAQLDGMASGINQSLSSTVAVINGDAQALARLNDQIVNAQSRYGGQPPNDLLDQRDALVQKIASNIGISTAKQDDGSINVFKASGQALVPGKPTTPLAPPPNPYPHGHLAHPQNRNTVTQQHAQTRGAEH